MRMSCNGCRVLRRGCTEDCILRPCLQWIKSSDCQANATLFLAKFYGRVGLVNLINAGPEHLRPAIFKSLLYEACGRIMNPMYGSVGLLLAGKWHHCQLAVDAVLKGSPIACADATAATHPILPLKGCDIRHVSKDADDLHRVRIRPDLFKRSGGTGKPHLDLALQFHTEPTQFSVLGWDRDLWEGPSQTPSNNSSVFSGESAEAWEPERPVKRERHIDESEVGLELALGFNPVLHQDLSAVERVVIEVSDNDA